MESARSWGWRLGAGIVALLLSPGLPALTASRWRRGVVFELVELGVYLLAVGAGWFSWATGFWLGLLLLLAWRMIAAVDAIQAPAAAKQMPWAMLVGMALGLLFGKEGVALFLRANVVEAFQSPNQGMAPTLVLGDKFFVGKHVAEVHRGDVLVFRRPDATGSPYVKRVIGIGGDLVAMTGDHLTVNGTPVKRRVTDESCPVVVESGSCVVWEETLEGRAYRVLAISSPRDEKWSVTVPPDSYFVLGDNRDNSNDSRHFGSVPKANRIGVPTFIWWSKDEAGFRLDRLNRRVE